ncbi:MAG: hypothetical protein EOO67_10665, partial [Microbacterium sp.]
MIRHRPSGSGHPYSVDTEQRWPVVPEAGSTAAVGDEGELDRHGGDRGVGAHAQGSGRPGLGD